MKERVKSSFGKCHVNEGTCVKLNTEFYILDHTRKFFLFDVIPMGKPRMTQSDRWKTNPNHADPRKRQRKCVTQYWDYKNTILWQGKSMNFEMKDFLDAVYLIPMPNSWSKKKKKEYNGMPHKSKPDTDNITKGLKDIFNISDSHVWYEKAEKRWAYKGSIILFG